MAETRTLDILAEDRMTPRQLRDAANRPWEDDSEAELALRTGCPICGAELHDMRGTGFNVAQAMAAGRCVIWSNTDYSCATKSRSDFSNRLR